MGQCSAERPRVGGDSRGADSMPLRWVPVSGGICRFGDSGRRRVVGDLLVTVTPLTYRQLGRAGEAGDEDLPITSVDHAEACQLAELVGGRLPTSVEWERLAGRAAAASVPVG
jgi:formylglycine-generating enzyme